MARTLSRSSTSVPVVPELIPAPGLRTSLHERLIARAVLEALRGALVTVRAARRGDDPPARAQRSLTSSSATAVAAAASATLA